MNSRAHSTGAGPLVVTFTVTLVLASPPSASANFKRQHASSCMEDGLERMAVFQDQFLVNASAWALDQFVCGMPEDTDVRKDKVVQLNVTGIDQSTVWQVTARACIGYFGGIG